MHLCDFNFTLDMGISLTSISKYTNNPSTRGNVVVGVIIAMNDFWTIVETTGNVNYKLKKKITMQLPLFFFLFFFTGYRISHCSKCIKSANILKR